MIELDIHLFGNRTNVPEIVTGLRRLFQPKAGDESKMPDVAVSVSPAIESPMNRALVYIMANNDELSDKRVVEACYQAVDSIQHHLSCNHLGITVEVKVVTTESLPPRPQPKK